MKGKGQVLLQPKCSTNTFCDDNDGNVHTAHDGSHQLHMVIST